MLDISENIRSAFINIRLCRRIINIGFFFFFGIGVCVGLAAEFNRCGIDDSVCFFGLGDNSFDGFLIFTFGTRKYCCCTAVVVRPSPCGFAVGVGMGFLFGVGIRIGLAIDPCCCGIYDHVVFFGFDDICRPGFLVLTSFIGTGQGNICLAVVVRPCPYRFSVDMCVGEIILSSSFSGIIKRKCRFMFQIENDPCDLIEGTRSNPNLAGIINVYGQISVEGSRT